MKKKDIIFAFLAVVILLAALYVGFTQLAPKKSASSSVVTVEVVGEIPGKLDAAGVAAINDAKTVVNYNSPLDFTGLGNTAPFGK